MKTLFLLIFIVNVLRTSTLIDIFKDVVLNGLIQLIFDQLLQEPIFNVSSCQGGFGLST